MTNITPPDQYEAVVKGRIDKHTIPVTESGCWIWMSALNLQGYGHMVMNTVHHRAHRLAWQVYRGPIPDGMFVLHRCDIRECVNPDHLFLGTQQDNMADMSRKGRWRPGRRIAA